MLVAALTSKDEKFLGYSIASIIFAVDKVLVGMEGDINIDSKIIKLYKEKYPDKFFVYESNVEDEDGKSNLMFDAVIKCQDVKRWPVKWVLTPRDNHIFYEDIHEAKKILGFLEEPQTPKGGQPENVGHVYTSRNVVYPNKTFINDMSMTFIRFIPGVRFEEGVLKSVYPHEFVAKNIQFVEMSVEEGKEGLGKFEPQFPSVLWGYKTGSSNDDIEWLKKWLDKKEKG